MELALAFILHLILSISINGSGMPRSRYGQHPYEQEHLLAGDRELQGIRESYDRLMFLKRGLSSVPSSFPNGAYLEEMEAMMHQTRTAFRNYIATHQAQSHSEKVRIVGDMISELEILQNLIIGRMNELGYVRQGLPHQGQLWGNRRTSQEQEPEHPSSSTEPPIHVIMPYSDRPTHFGYHKPAPGSQQRDQGSSSNAGRGPG